MVKNFAIKKLSDGEELLPGFRKVWAAIKAATGSRVRCPKSLAFTDVPRALLLNDDECGARFALNLETLELSEALRVSGGEWAIRAGSNNDEEIRGVPGNAAVLSCCWNDYHRYFSIEVLVAKLPEALPAREVA